MARGYDNSTIAVHYPGAAVSTILLKVAANGRGTAGTTAAAHSAVNATTGADTILNMFQGTYLTAAALAGDMTLNVGTSQYFPASGDFVVMVDSEQILVQGSGKTLTVVQRGYGGTIAAAHPVGAVVQELSTPTYQYAELGRLSTIVNQVTTMMQGEANGVMYSQYDAAANSQIPTIGNPAPLRRRILETFSPATTSSTLSTTAATRSSMSGWIRALPAATSRSSSTATRSRSTWRPPPRGRGSTSIRRPRTC